MTQNPRRIRRCSNPVDLATALKAILEKKESGFVTLAELKIWLGYLGLWTDNLRTAPVMLGLFGGLQGCHEEFGRGWSGVSLRADVAKHILDARQEDIAWRTRIRQEKMAARAQLLELTNRLQGSRVEDK